jgi:hypothetical protein
MKQTGLVGRRAQVWSVILSKKKKKVGGYLPCEQIYVNVYIDPLPYVLFYCFLSNYSFPFRASVLLLGGIMYHCIHCHNGTDP